MVDAIYAQAELRLTPHPLPAGRECLERIRDADTDRRAAHGIAGALISSLKDLVQRSALRSARPRRDLRLAPQRRPPDPAA
jgi:hypothetical protein